SGASLEKGRHDQLLTALRALLLSRKNPFGDIKSDGTVKTALENLRLGAGAPAIGIPFFWPSAAMPNTVMTEWADMVFLKFNGATFSASTYPKLALVIPSLTLPDARGEFPRIWDDGRGVDSGRSLLSSQSSGAPNITGGMTSIGVVRGVSASGAITSALSSDISNLTSGSSSAIGSFTFDASKSNSVYQSISEVRPRNIAFNFLVRAK
ncbi:phage tail protein, partial [Escherichia coli]